MFSYIRFKFGSKELIEYHSYSIDCERADVFFQILNAKFQINNATTKTEKRRRNKAVPLEFHISLLRR